jgi:hypothetical protein
MSPSSSIIDLKSQLKIAILERTFPRKLDGERIKVALSSDRAPNDGDLKSSIKNIIAIYLQ